ncbi:MAG: hypothetical protein U0Q22_02495 [Acidimicrobiales bacterium]
MTADVVVVVPATFPVDGRRQVRHLVDTLATLGATAEILVVGGVGDPTGWERVGPTVDLDHRFRRRTATVRRLVRPGEPDRNAPTRWRSRFLRRRGRAAWIACDTTALSLLSSLPIRPSVVVGVLADPGAVLRPEATAISPDLWLALTARQVGAGQHGAGIEVVQVVGSLSPTDIDVLAPPDGTAAGPVVLSTPPGRWEAVDHMVEVVDRLLMARPGLPLVVLTDPGDDLWLTRHDLAHVAGRNGEVTAVPRDALPRLRPPVIVRTGYVASDPDLVLAAAATGIPIVGFELGDLPELASTAVEPFAVEEMVGRVLAVLDTADGQSVAATFADAARGRGTPEERLQPLLALLDRPGFR